MKLTDGERLIVVMLAEVMEALKLNREIDPSLIKTLACNHDDWAIKYKYSALAGSEAPSDADVKETNDLLWMWGIIESGISKLGGTEAEEAKGWHWARFHGFDANHDPHYGIAHTLLNHLDAFSDLKDHALNSHSQGSLPRYRAMYEKFDRYVHEGKASPLQFEALRDLCS